ncbi:MAG TPA: hypothetical protein DIT28_15935 [Oxalobacteraceae bacterium]|jgi:hypothetical protein|nr:hypothetical protein [Oxalobacteraceae bacterium]HCN90640.1 hypothetical protein [Oxalobacteraceae bacterium]
MTHLATGSEQLPQAKNMTIRLSFIDSIKVLSKYLVGTASGKRRRAALARSSHAETGDPQIARSGVPAIAAKATTVARPGSENANRLRLANQKERRKIEHTHSNLG